MANLAESNRIFFGDIPIDLDNFDSAWWLLLEYSLLICRAQIAILSYVGFDLKICNNSYINTKNYVNFPCLKRKVKREMESVSPFQPNAVSKFVWKSLFAPQWNLNVECINFGQYDVKTNLPISIRY